MNSLLFHIRFIIPLLMISSNSLAQNYHDHFVNALYQVDQASLHKKTTAEHVITFLEVIKESYNLPITFERKLSTVVVSDTNSGQSLTLKCREFNKDLEVQLWALCNLVRPYIRDSFEDREDFEYSEFIGDLLVSTIDFVGWALYEDSRNILLSNYETGFSIKRDSSRFFRVSSVKPSSKSWKQGISNGDVITKIHNIDTRKLGHGMFQIWLMDTINKTVPIEINRGNQVIQLNVVVEPKPFLEHAWRDTSYRENQSIEYLGISMITKKAVELLRASNETNGLTNKSLIVDLRNCRGGQVKSIAKFCEFFLNQDDTLYTSVYSTPYGGRLKTYSRTNFDEKQSNFNKVWLLCNRASISGAEMILLALQQLENVSVVGTTTQGRLTSERLIPGSANGKKCFVMFTAGKTLSKNMEDLNGIGITPDIELNEDEDALEYVISKMTH